MDVVALASRLDEMVEFALLRAGVLVDRPMSARAVLGPTRPVRLYTPLKPEHMPRTPAEIAARRFQPDTDMHLNYRRARQYASGRHDVAGSRLREVESLRAPAGALRMESGRANQRLADALLPHLDRRRLWATTTAQPFGHQAKGLDALVRQYKKWGFVERPGELNRRKMRLRQEQGRGLTRAQRESLEDQYFRDPFRGRVPRAVPMVRAPGAPGAPKRKT